MEKALLAEIDSLKNCTAGNEYFAEFFGVSIPTITRAIAHLKDLGLVKSAFDGRIRTLSLIKMIRQPNQNDEELTYSISTNSQQLLLTDNTDKEDTYKIKAQKFVDDFNSICVSLPKCVRMTSKRSKGITNLIKKYKYEDILEVFHKLEASDFCSGRSGRWRADIDFILREDKFISVLEGKYDNQGRKCNVETISRGEKRQLSAEEREAILKNGKKF